MAARRITRIGGCVAMRVGCTYAFGMRAALARASQRPDSIGVSVNDTNSDTKMANDIVRPNEPRKRRRCRS